MPVAQYTYFALSSRDTSAAEIAAILGIEPDETTVRASRSTYPRPVPIAHRWMIVCRDTGLRVDEQIARILQRLAPHTEAIAALARRLDSAEADAPNLFGWQLDHNVLGFLQATGAVLDVDEYDMTPANADS